MKKIIQLIIYSLVSIAFLALFYIDPFNNGSKLIFLILFIVAALSSGVIATIMFYDKKGNKITVLEKRLEAWNDISYHVSQAGDEVFNELPVGIIVYDENFTIKWANKNIKTIFQNVLIDLSLNEISPEIVMNIRAKNSKYVFKYEEQYFEILANLDNMVLYFFDQTQREELQIRYKNRTSAIAIIAIDNLDESLKRYDMQEQSNIKGQILGEIADYASEFTAYLQSFNDRLVLLFDKESLDLMIEDKFDILNDVRNIAQKNHLKTSVSIGIACYDVEYDELGSLAQSALELALKRGGDQVVVNIQNEKMQYFGGKANALEKSSLVNARLQATAIKEACLNASNILVMTHRMADCDAFASLLAMVKLCKATGKDTKGLIDENNVDSSVKKIISYLEDEDSSSLKDLVSLKEADIKSNTLLIIVDTQSPTIAMMPDILSKVNDLIVIDHHIHGEVTFNNPIVNYVEPYASSTIELITELFMFFGDNIEFTPALATIALAGLVVDTNNFTYRTGSRTFEAASILKDYDGDMSIVKNLLRDSYELETLLAKNIANAEVVLSKFAIVKIPDDVVLEERTILAKMSDRLLKIDGIEAAFTIGCIEKPGFVGVSARSLDKINVQLIMEEMGGGGHLNAAAYQKEGTTVELIYNEVLDILKRDFINEGEEGMKVILLQDVKGRGSKDQIIDVANGYGNYLLTNNLAILANEENIKNLEIMKEKERQDAIDHKRLMEKLKAEIESKSINVYIKIGADGKTFGHITNKQIGDEFEAQTGIKIDKRKIILQSEINSVGIYQATVNLHKEVVANIEIKVLEK